MHIKIAKHYYGQLNTYSLITLMKTDQHIERHNLPKLIKKKKEMDNLNRSVFIDLHGGGVCMFSCAQLFATSWTVDCHAPLPMEFFQASILEKVAIFYSRGSFLPRN